MALKEFSDQIGKENIVILASFSKPRDLVIFNRVHNIEYDIYNLEFKKINEEIEDWGSPFLFILNYKLETELIFIPLKEIPELLHSYLEIITYRFFSED